MSPCIFSHRSPLCSVVKRKRQHFSRRRFTFCPTLKTLFAPAFSSFNTLTAHVKTPLYLNAYALLLNSGITSILGLVFWAVAARLYPAETVGLNSALLATMVFLSAIAQLNLKSAMYRLVPSAGTATRRLILSAYVASLGASIIITIVFLLGMNTWAPALTNTLKNSWYALGLVGGAALYSIFALQDTALTGLRQTQWVPVENAIFAVSKLVLLIAFASAPFASGIFLSFTLPLAFIIVPLNLLLFRRWIPKHLTQTRAPSPPITFSHVARFVGGDYIGQLFALSSMAVLPLLVTNTLGASANAYFYLAWVAAGSLQLLNINFAVSLTVEAAADEQQLSQFTRRVLLHSMRLLIPAVLGLVLFAPLLLALFGKAYAAESTTVLRLLVLAALPHNLIALWLGIARVRRQIRQIIFVQAVNGILLLGTSAALMSVYGINGVGLGVLVSETLIAFVLLLTQFIPLLSRAPKPTKNPAIETVEASN